MFDVITVGSATVDVFARTEYSRIIKSPNKKECIAYPVGSKILIEELIISSGGGGTNTAAALSMLGHKVAFLGKIGTQENAHRIRLELRKYNIDCSLLVYNRKSRTGYSIILDSDKHDRTILTFRGSNSDLGYNDINLKKLKAKWFLFTALKSKSLTTQKKLASYAKRNKIKLAFVLSPYLAKLGIKKIRPIIQKTNVVIMNKEEAELLLGKGDIKGLLRKLRKLGHQIVVITDGNKGANAFDGDYFYYGKPNKIKAVETTGAGDAFASSFLSGIIKKKDVEYAMRLGMTNAESVISYHGSKNKLLTYNEALKRMKKAPIKITKRKQNNKI